MLVMRTDLSGNPTFLEVLKRVKQMTLAAYQHQDVPFEQIIEMLQPQRSFNRAPLYQIEFTLQNAPLEPLEVGGLRFSPLEVQAVSSETDLNLMMSESENGLVGEVLYATDLFDATTIERMMSHFQNLLEEIAKAPEQRFRCNAKRCSSRNHFRKRRSLSNCGKDFLCFGSVVSEGNSVAVVDVAYRHSDNARIVLPDCAICRSHRITLKAKVEEPDVVSRSMQRRCNAR